MVQIMANSVHQKQLDLLMFFVVQCLAAPTKLNLYSIFYQLLNYAPPVWSPHSKQNINLLESILHCGA